MSEKKQDRPWIMRTYAGHTTAEDTNKLFKTNLSKGQTGLSVAFDLPTQTGYDSDHVLASGEVGKVGVLISNLSDKYSAFGCLRRGLYITILFKQTSTKLPGDYLGRLVLGEEDDEVKVFGATIF